MQHKNKHMLPQSSTAKPWEVIVPAGKWMCRGADVMRPEVIIPANAYTWAILP